MDLSKSIEISSAKSKFVLEVVPPIQPILDRGNGSYVYDLDGNKYLDLNSGQFCICLGHNYKPFIKTVTAQLSKIYHTNTSTLSAEMFNASEKIAKITNGKLEKTIFLSTGSEANECAFRYSRFLTNKNTIIAFDKGYHGLTLGSQALTMGGQWARPHIPNGRFIETDILKDNPNGKDLDEFKKHIEGLIQSSNMDVAAMVFEPFLGVGGMLLVNLNYLTAMREICDKYQIILIADECQTGFARSGEWFFYQKSNITPDILILAKSMGMGFPVSSATFRKELANEIEGKFIHFSSHQNDPLAAKIVSFVIDEIESLRVLEKNKKNGKYILDSLIDLSIKYPIMKRPRGVGMMMAFDFDKELLEEFPNITKKFLLHLQDQGILLQAICRGLTFRILPNYLITEEEIDFFIGSLSNSMNYITKWRSNN